MSVTKKDLTVLIEKLQKNADKVEKNILETEQNLNKDVIKINEGKPPLYQDSTNKTIENSLLLLNGLDENAAEAKRLQHPQAEMIEHDMKQLRERVKKLCNDHDHIYHLTRSEGVPSLNWNKIIDEKTAILNSKGFGEDLPTIENEVEEHNIIHSEVEALAPYIGQGDKEYVDGLQLKYNKLLANSTARQKNLLSLRDYMQRCTNELYWLDQQADERIMYDWSDANLDYPARKRQYENFISKCLESKEGTITKLSDDGEKLIAQGHPGKNIIEAYMDAVHADWKEYLNLLICEENHLKNMDEYHKFQMESRDTLDLLKCLETEINQKYNPDFKDQYQLEGLLADLKDQGKAMDSFDDRVKSLQNRSLQVLPLKYRRTAPQKLLPIEALCDFDTEGGQINRGERYTMLRNNGPKWDVKDSSGRTLAAPGICFIIPPTDPESVAIAENLVSQQKANKQKVESSQTVLQTRLGDLKKDSTGGQDKQELQCRQLMAGLDKVVNDLDKQEKAIYSQVRPPLEQNRPVQDSADRLQNMRDIASAVRKIEPEKTSKIREAETFLKTNPKCASAPQLSSKVDTTINKHNKVQQLLQCADDRLKNSNKLETSIQNGKNLLMPYENRLAREEIAPSDPTSLDMALRELSDMGSELKAKSSIIPELDNNLRSSKNSCDNMVNKVQEHCLDFDRQEAEVQKLNKRYDNLLRQIDTRSQSLQRAKNSYNGYRKDYDNLNSWLSRIPNYEAQETDTIQQVEGKLTNQRNLLSDISRKESDLNTVSENAQLYQQAVRDYENEAERFRFVLNLKDGLVTQTYKRSRLESPALRVKREEAAIEAKFTEVNALNKQRLQNLEFAQSLLNRQAEMQVIQHNVQTVKSSAPGDESCRIKNQLEDEILRRQQLEKEVKTIQTDSKLEIRDKESREKVTVKQKVVLQQDSQQEKEHSILRLQVEEERHKRMLLEKEYNLLVQQHQTLEKMEVREKVVCTEKVQVEADPEAKHEIERLKRTLEEETKRRQELDIQLSTSTTKLIELEFTNTKSTKELDYIREESSRLLQENQRLQSKIRKLQSEMDSSRSLEIRLTALHKELQDLRRITSEKDKEIEGLQKSLSAVSAKREQRENHFCRTFVVINPNTGKEMRPEEAFKQGLIEGKMFVNLQTQECDWEEITVNGPNGASSVLCDKKSGKEFSIDDALRSETITKNQLQQYQNKEISLQEFGLMVSAKRY
ncbi:periplakin-like [Tachysurus fulvidraco]|uniref:periplakin-like n=1 Tax=Tachysurus fulvidraco TaxID=1234273 RepID=UPI001FEE85A7|nr:periplakin-like [Tachysurus fulvidraco]